MIDVKTPDWVKRAVFYQIFPDRFARSRRTQHVRGIHFKPWGSPPAEQGFQGGDLYGVAEKLDYLQELGVTALYLNPIFSSASNHRYHTFDYMTVDPLLGGDAALRFLLDEAHARAMRVVLDGVFNHASRGFWAFHHILETGGNSPYLDWFHVHGWPLNPYPRSGKEKTNYGAWWDNAALPKFNTNNPGVRDYLLEVARYWINFGIDGWRLDVPEEIKDEGFWQEFRAIVKAGNPDAYIVGEIWHDAEEWLRGDRFDAVMNYVFSRNAMGFFGAETLRTEERPGGFDLMPLTARQFARRVDHMVSIHHPEITQAQMNMLDSHDTARILWMYREDESALRLSLLFQMVMPGTPCIYYGTEIGMTGGPEPESRGAFPWEQAEQWNHDLLEFSKAVVALRHRYAALSVGTYRTLLHDHGHFAMRRDFEGELVVVIFNTAHAAEEITVELAPHGEPHEEGSYTCVWGDEIGREVNARTGKLRHVRVGARSAVVLVKKAVEEKR